MTDFLKVKNRAVTSLAKELLIGDTIMEVVDTSAIPSEGRFRLTVEDEIVEVTGVSGATLTIERGVEGTTPSYHANGRTVSLNITAGIIEELQVAVKGVLGSVTDLDTLSGKVTQNETDIGNIKGVLGSVTDLDTLSGKVTQNETDIGIINNTTLKSASLTKRTASNQFNTVFKNGSKLRLVTAVCVQTGISYHVVIEANNITTPLGVFDPPTSWAVLGTREPEDSTVNQVSITFIVPPLYYYTVARRGGGEEPGGHVEISYADLF